jgi:hypothetical protein
MFEWHFLALMGLERGKYGVLLFYAHNTRTSPLSIKVVLQAAGKKMVGTGGRGGKQGRKAFVSLRSRIFRGFRGCTIRSYWNLEPDLASPTGAKWQA